MANYWHRKNTVIFPVTHTKKYILYSHYLTYVYTIFCYPIYISPYIISMLVNVYPHCLFYPVMLIYTYAHMQIYSYIIAYILKIFKRSCDAYIARLYHRYFLLKRYLFAQRNITVSSITYSTVKKYLPDITQRCAHNARGPTRTRRNRKDWEDIYPPLFSLYIQQCGIISNPHIHYFIYTHIFQFNPSENALEILPRFHWAHSSIKNYYIPIVCFNLNDIY